MNLLIDEEQKKMAAVDNYPRTAYDSLVKMKNTHRENVRILTEAINSKSCNSARIEDIDNYVEELLRLKHSGPQFAQMLAITKNVQKRHFEHFQLPPVDFSRKTGAFAQATNMYKKQCLKTGNWPALSYDQLNQQQTVEDNKENKRQKKRKRFFF